MDIWEPAPRRHKRSFREMSTLSPSPMNFGDPPSSNFFSTAASRLASAATENITSFFQTRRTSHPHNVHSQRASEALEEMPDLAQSQRRPQLEHRTSQTVIDLTDEPEDPPAPPPSNAEPARRQRPPQLGRSDAISLGGYIDLTDDSGDADIMITGERQLPNPPSRSHLRLPPPHVYERDNSPPLFMSPVQRPNGPPTIQHSHRHSLGAILGQRVDLRVHAIGHGHFPAFNMMDQDFMNQLHQQVHNMHQPMPGALNYQHPAWADRKPEHVPPPPARENFTRSPNEGDVVICPSCEQELVQSKDIEEPVAKKGGKAPTRKEREEHPFWVVRECGHVYCNSCYQLRTTTSKNSQLNFREVTKATSKAKASKVLKCAVEDCDSDVKSKERWVGVFL